MGNTPSVKEWGRVEPSDRRATLAHVLQRAKTGDIILFQGAGAESRAIRCASVLTTWSHVGIVLVLPDGTKAITEAYPTPIGKDIVRRNAHRGVQIGDLERRLKTYPSQKVAWRPLSRGNASEEREEDLARRVADLVRVFRAWEHDEVPQYSSFWHDWIEYGTRTDDDDNVRDGRKHYVCTSWAAAVLMHLDILDHTERAGNYLLSDFGFPLRKIPTMQHGYILGTIHYIVPPSYQTTRRRPAAARGDVWVV